MKARGWATAHRTTLIIAAALILFGLVLWQASPLPETSGPPLQIDLAFDSLVGARQWLLARAADSKSILIGITVIAQLIIWPIALIKRRTRQAVSASIGLACACVALQAQVDLMSGKPAEGGTLYLIAAAIFFAWAIISNRSSATRPLTIQPANHRTAELVFLTLVMAAGIFGRIYDLKRMPYGIDGDEGKWTIEVVSVVFDGQDTLSSEYHRRQLPMSFLMETPFQVAMGAGLTPGRVGAAVYGIVATFIFYRLARRLYDVPIALTATLLLGVSLPDITASRAGNVESYVRLWSVLPLYGLTVALDTRELRHFVWAGVALAGAMITYETLMPVVAATVTIAIGAAWTHRREGRIWLRRLAAYATAPAGVVVLTIDYLLGRMQYYQAYRSAAESYSLGEQLLRGIQGLLQPFYSPPINDALFNRQGPYINGLLVPLLVLGSVYAIARAPQRGNALSLTWLAWAFIPVPVVLHTPLPRILYPGLPVLYLFIAVAWVSLYRAIGEVVQLPKVTTALGIMTLGTFALLNFTIWFQEITDTPDELRRRQVAEIVAANVDPGGVILMPKYPFGETVEIERELMALLIRERRRTTDAGEYRAVNFDDLLPTLSREGAGYAHVTVLYDLLQDALRDQRQAIIAALQRCYPGVQATTAGYFGVYRLSRSDLTHPVCYSTHLTVAAPPPVVEGGAGARVKFDWSLESAPATQTALTCRRGRPDLLWIEAETFPVRDHWIADTRFVTGWSGSGYLADDYNSQFAETTIDIPRAGTYRVWVRSYRRHEDGFPAFMDIAGQTLSFAKTNPGALNTWVWEPLADLPLDGGPLAIRMTRPFTDDQSKLISLFVDAVALSADPSFDPSRDERWQPVLELRRPDQTPQARGTFEAKLDPGSYRCEVSVRDGDRLIDPSGKIGITSDPIYFDVKP